MKKYLSGILAVLLAIGFSAFTSGKPNSVAYHYTSNSFLKADVETASNWDRSGTPTPENCGDLVQDVTCTIELPSTDYEIPFGTTLDASKIQIVTDFLSGTDEMTDPVYVTDALDDQDNSINSLNTVKGELP